MKPIIYSALIFLLVFSSCGENKISDNKSDSLSAKTVEKDTPAQVVKDYLCWYSANYPKIGKIELVKNNPPADTTLFYSINFEGTEQWLKAFKESGFVSGEFISHWKNYFAGCEKDFQQFHENDGPPSGFDYDFIFNSQEEFPSCTNIQKAPVIENVIAGDRCTVTIDVSVYEKITKKLIKSADGKWLIAE